ncbi:Ribulose-phosphate 3-epimerase [Clostridiaceae bacterium JG1575]|nr:Ribulose-phosphate 3-epimerase [Clostridiaceae bacterium JG1575]
MGLIAPSILSADFAALGEDIEAITKGGADWIHVDVMDGSFVPNISIGLPVVSAIRGRTTLPFDVHLMIVHPSLYFKDFADAGADWISFHWEAEVHADRAVSRLKELGVKAGIVLNPATPVSVLEDLLPQLDYVLLMSVNPGFGGQTFIPYVTQKIVKLRAMAQEKNPNLIIQVDGGVDAGNIRMLKEAGADCFVAGSAVFRGRTLEKNLQTLRDAMA